MSEARLWLYPIRSFDPQLRSASRWLWRERDRWIFQSVFTQWKLTPLVALHKVVVLHTILYLFIFHKQINDPSMNGFSIHDDASRHRRSYRWGCRADDNCYSVDLGSFCENILQERFSRLFGFYVLLSPFEAYFAFAPYFKVVRRRFKLFRIDILFVSFFFDRSLVRYRPEHDHTIPVLVDSGFDAWKIQRQRLPEAIQTIFHSTSVTGNAISYRNFRVIRCNVFRVHLHSRRHSLVVLWRYERTSDLRLYSWSRFFSCFDIFHGSQEV